MKITNYPNSKCVITVINPLVDNDQELECRICYESDGRLLNVCSCSGSIEYVHIECIERWINTFPKNHKNHYKCEICNQNYYLNYKQKIQKKDKYNLYRIIFVFLFFLSVVIFITLLIVLLT